MTEDLKHLLEVAYKTPRIVIITHLIECLAEGDRLSEKKWEDLCTIAEVIVHKGYIEKKGLQTIFEEMELAEKARNLLDPERFKSTN